MPDVRSLVIAASCAAVLASASSQALGAGSPKGGPNLLLIVADDMGYSDLGCFGGEIPTPHLDALARRGLRAANFHVNPTCSPTRATLLTGADNHLAGLGNMAEFLGPEQKGKPGYEGHLNDRVVCVARLLRDAGYHTYMAGKWHLGEEPEHWPARNGFERDFTVLQGGGSNWPDMLYPNPAHPRLTFTRDGKRLEELPRDHFSTAAYSDFIMRCATEHKDDEKPFFAYLSFQAVHAPLASPDDWLNRSQGRYDDGYDAARARRLTRMKELGIVAGDVTAPPRLPSVPAWDSLTRQQQALSARRMEVYAAMLANMDHHVGRVLDHLRRIGKLDNTVVVFLSDNGPEAAGFSEAAAKAFSPDAKAWMEKTFDFRPERWGKEGSVVDYGAAWAQVGSTPFRGFKGFVSEGGIRAPLIVAGPGVKHEGDVTHALLHVADIVPTLLDLAGVEHPSGKKGSGLAPVRSKSLRPLLEARADSVRTEADWLGWELFGNRAILQGEWKLMYLLKGAGGTGGWQLFNLANDPAEARDLAARHPERCAALLKLWDEYVTANGVIVSDAGPFAQPEP